MNKLNLSFNRIQKYTHELDFPASKNLYWCQPIWRELKYLTDLFFIFCPAEG